MLYPVASLTRIHAMEIPMQSSRSETSRVPTEGGGDDVSLFPPLPPPPPPPPFAFLTTVLGSEFSPPTPLAGVFEGASGEIGAVWEGVFETTLLDILEAMTVFTALRVTGPKYPTAGWIPTF